MAFFWKWIAPNLPRLRGSFQSAGGRLYATTILRDPAGLLLTLTLTLTLSNPNPNLNPNPNPRRGSLRGADCRGSACGGTRRRGQAAASCGANLKNIHELAIVAPDA